jgi:hypothetical protein
MKKTFGIGELVMYDDLWAGKILCVVLADGLSGFNSETRVIYVVYCFELNENFLAYESEVYELEETDSPEIIQLP